MRVNVSSGHCTAKAYLSAPTDRCPPRAIAAISCEIVGCSGLTAIFPNAFRARARRTETPVIHRVRLAFPSHANGSPFSRSSSRISADCRPSRSSVGRSFVFGCGRAPGPTVGRQCYATRQQRARQEHTYLLSRQKSSSMLRFGLVAFLSTNYPYLTAFALGIARSRASCRTCSAQERQARWQAGIGGGTNGKAPATSDRGLSHLLRVRGCTSGRVSHAAVNFLLARSVWTLVSMQRKRVARTIRLPAARRGGGTDLAHARIAPFSRTYADLASGIELKAPPPKGNPPKNSHSACDLIHLTPRRRLTCTYFVGVASLDTTKRGAHKKGARSQATWCRCLEA